MASRRSALPRLVLATALLLTACQVTSPAKVPAARASKPPAPAASQAPAGLRATVTPTAATASRTPAALTAAPDTLTLTGTVRLDAGYAVKSGVGRVISNHGGSAVAFADASLIANNSGNLVANNAGNLIANNGGGLLAAWGSGIISDKGAGIISDKGAGIISDKGAGIISDKGAGLISDKGAGYALAGLGLRQAAAAPAATPSAGAAPAVGEILPAAGMVIGVVDLRTGALIPIGRDPAGEPVLAIYTDDRGGYTLHLPAALATNVVVVAVPPIARIDRRLALDLVTAPSGDTAAVDEDTALASRFMREFLVGIMADAMSVSGPEKIVIKTGAVSESLRVVVRTFLEEINAESAAVGLRAAPRAESEKVARRMSDVILATVNLPEVTITSDVAAYWTKPPAPAVTTMVTVLRETREKATEALRRDAAFFESQGYFREANAGRPPADAFRIDKPADLGDFVIREYLLTTRGSTEGVDNVFNSLAVGPTEADGTNTRRKEIEAGALAIGGAIVGALLANKDGAHDEGIKAIRAWKPAP